MSKEEDQTFIIDSKIPSKPQLENWPAPSPIFPTNWADLPESKKVTVSKGVTEDGRECWIVRARPKPDQ